MAFFSRLIKYFGFSDSARPASISRTRMMRLEPLEDRRLLTAAPDDFRVVRTDKTEVSLEWVPREEIEVTGYEVQVSINGIDNWRPFFGHDPYVQGAVQTMYADCVANAPSPPTPMPPCYLGVTGVPRRCKSFWSWELWRIDGDKNGLLGVNIGLTTRCFPGKEAEP